MRIKIVGNTKLYSIRKMHKLLTEKLSVFMEEKKLLTEFGDSNEYNKYRIEGLSKAIDDTLIDIELIVRHINVRFAVKLDDGCMTYLDRDGGSFRLKMPLDNPEDDGKIEEKEKE